MICVELQRALGEAAAWKRVVEHHRLRTARFRLQARMLAADVDDLRNAIAEHRRQLVDRADVEDWDLWRALDTTAPAPKETTAP